ncbi:PLP-dependent transferase [Pelomyxa schiedti]|nr:PLP-dependent transferase [Pelomyxa schiedti]
MAGVNFGRGMLSEFGYEEGYTCLNHGSFGSLPNRVFNAQREIQVHAEKRPDKWFRAEMYNHLTAQRNAAGTLMHADPDDLVFVNNATYAFNAVLGSLFSLPQEQPVTILYLSIAYPSLKNTLEHFSKRSRGMVQLMEVDIHPLLRCGEGVSASIVEAVRHALEQNKLDATSSSSSEHAPVGFAVVDHISSIPSLVLPVYDLVDLLHSQGVPVMVDGAHALGQVPVDLTRLGPEYYFTNAHKWLFASRGCAVLYVCKKMQPQIYPPVISWLGQGPSEFQRRFSYLGTDDISALLSFSHGLAFMDYLGGVEVVSSHNHTLVIRGAHFLAEKWNTSLLLDDESMIGSMACVQMPMSAVTPEEKQRVHDFPMEMLEKRNIYAPSFVFNNKAYFRLSAQVFNEIEDFLKLANVVSELLSS